MLVKIRSVSSCFVEKVGGEPSRVKMGGGNVWYSHTSTSVNRGNLRIKVRKNFEIFFKISRTFNANFLCVVLYGFLNPFRLECRLGHVLGVLVNFGVVLGEHGSVLVAHEVAQGDDINTVD